MFRVKSMNPYNTIGRSPLSLDVTDMALESASWAYRAAPNRHLRTEKCGYHSCSVGAAYDAKSIPGNIFSSSL